MRNSRLALIPVALVMLATTAFAEPITYDVVAKPGEPLGSTVVGTVTFADGASGSSYDIETAGTEFDLKIVDYATPGVGWNSNDSLVTVVGPMSFEFGQIGDAVLTPFQDGGASAPFPSIWLFRTGRDPVAGIPWKLFFFGDYFGAEWFWVDGNNDILGGSISSSGFVSWELRLAKPVPEPGTLVLSGLAIAGVLAWRRRKRRA